MSLEGKHALVTGAGSGLGAAIARALDAQGARLTLIGRRLEPLQAVAKDCRNAQCQSLDVTDPEAVERVFALLGEPLDILVNNAGTAPSAPFRKLTLAAWRDTLAVNLDGTFHCTQAAIASLLQRPAARIINIASTSALKGYAYVAAYCAAKHGVLGLTRALAAEYANQDITVNAICPGFAETEMLTRSVANITASSGRSEAEARTLLAANNPQQRFIQGAEVAATVIWLAGNEARSITGQAISISGGETV